MKTNYFASNLKYLREKEGYSQEYIGEIMSKKLNTISQYEAGKNFPTLDNFIKVIELFDFSADDFLWKDLSLPENTQEVAKGSEQRSTASSPQDYLQNYKQAIQKIEKLYQELIETKNEVIQSHTQQMELLKEKNETLKEENDTFKKHFRERLG